MSDIQERPKTPPPQASSSSSTQQLQLTPEQIKRIEINRLRAKARQRQREQEAAASSSASNTNNKRPLAVVPATSTSPTTSRIARGDGGANDASGDKNKKGKLARDKRLGTYFEYDLSKMVNSKGGFLVEEGADEDLERMRRKERERERQRAEKNTDIPVFLDKDKNPKCRECGSMEIDVQMMRVFRCLICKRCENEKPELYSLLTKTECKDDYLLTDAELRDEEELPHLLKANPHKSTFANMMLFLRYQVEAFAWKKWGSPEALDAEWERRTAEKRKKKNKKFEEGLRELRKRTKEGVWQRRMDEQHQHDFGQLSGGKQVCKGCGFTVEVEEFQE